MNIVMIMSGGVGKRFGSVIPKQYNMLGGRPVIDYVIDAVNGSELKDKVVVVIDKQCIQFSDQLRHSDFDFAPNGHERYDSLNNGFEFIKSHYDCSKVVILDAVAPFVYPDLIDDYFRLLDDYDAVITAQKITGALGNYDFEPLDREKYYMTQSPEAFRFQELIKYFDPGFKSQELAWQLPRESKKYLNFDFKNNLKLTYDFQLKYAEYMMEWIHSNELKKNIQVYEKSDFITEGLKAYLLRLYPGETNEWLRMVCDSYNRLAEKWDIRSFIPNQSSRYGLVMTAESGKLGDVVMKFIPPFIGRYAKEKEAYKYLSHDYMCPLLDADDSASALLLRRIRPAGYAKFENNIMLTRFFDTVVRTAVKDSDLPAQAHRSYYYDSLTQRLDKADEALFFKDEIKAHLERSVKLFNRCFAGGPMYLTHGDLHEFNILEGEQDYFAVDPIGGIAPIELEFARFIRNDIINNKAFGMKERLEYLLHYFTRWADRLRLLRFEYIDTVLVTYNSTFENADDAQTAFNLKLIDLIDDMIIAESKGLE